ncbi:MAG: hypothetical protein FWC13_13560 [Oscillospiraceae bacterium]|nr:hypothetical protein [Oscillospiraceae bacterium]
MESVVKKPTSWGWVILWLFLFWPIGLFMLIKRFSNRQVLMNSKTRAPAVAAWILIALGGLMLFTMITQGSFEFFMFLWFAAYLVGGIMILVKLKQTEKLAAQFRRYLNIIVNTGERNLTDIASSTAVPYETARKDIQSMIDYGFLKNAHIDERNHTIVLAQYSQVQTVAPEQMASQSTVQSGTVRCSGCGANNVVTSGRITECEFCATALV